MCRLGGVSSAVDVRFEDFFGGMRRLSEEGHSHGAGAVAMGVGETDYRAPFRTTSPAHESDGFERVLSEKAALGLIHIRYATMGKADNVHNLHPFVDGRHAMAHNGTAILFADRKRNFQKALRRVKDGEIVRRLKADKANGKIRGSTDSEHLFRLYLAFLGNEAETPQMGFAPMARALSQTVMAMTASADPEYARILRQHSALNMVATDSVSRSIAATCHGRDLYISDGKLREHADAGPAPEDGQYLETLIVASQPSPSEFQKYNWWRVRDGFVVGRDRDGLFHAKRIEDMASPNSAERVVERAIESKQDGLRRVSVLEPKDTLDHGISALAQVQEELDHFWSVRQAPKPDGLEPPAVAA